LVETSQTPSKRKDWPGVEKCIRASIRVLLPPEKRNEALIILKSVIKQTELEPGCISCRLYQDSSKKHALMLEEIWDSETDLQHHLGSDKFLTVLLVVEMSIERPEVRFDVISHSTGMETIEKVRTRPEGSEVGMPPAEG
jgi:quinol monooxygenase YgiN